MSIPPSHLVTIGGLIFILAYWHLTEQQSSQASPARTGHSRFVQVASRLLPIVVGAGLIAQLLGWAVFPLPLPSGLAHWVTWLGHVILWGGIILAVWSRQTLGENWAHAADFQVIPGQSLVTAGPYRYIRHPIYVAFISFFIGTELILTSWLIVFALPLLGYIFWQARQEETLLAASFGQTYRSYQARTGMFLPRVAVDKSPKKA